MISHLLRNRIFYRLKRTMLKRFNCVFREYLVCTDKFNCELKLRRMQHEILDSYSLFAFSHV